MERRLSTKLRDSRMQKDEPITSFVLGSGINGVKQIKWYRIVIVNTSFRYVMNYLDGESKGLVAVRMIHANMMFRSTSRI